MEREDAMGIIWIYVLAVRMICKRRIYEENTHTLFFGEADTIKYRIEHLSNLFNNARSMWCISKIELMHIGKNHEIGTEWRIGLKWNKIIS